jgi:serine/threonine protein kinase
MFSARPPKPSPYDQSVDMWSLGAVLYHILCGSPPYMGRGDDRGAQMLRNIMTTDADLDLLRSAGVSEEGIDFVSKLLNRDPQARPKEKECFQHPWIANVPDIDEYSDDEVFSPEKTLTMIQEKEEEELDASQLSIHDDLDSEIDSPKDGLSQSEVKRPRLEEVEIRYPSLPQIGSFPAPNGHQRTPNRLFGEVTASALQDPGTLEGLGPISFSGIDDASFSSYHSSSGESMDDIHGLAAVSSFPVPNFGGSAPSLMGAEALVGQLKMSSSAGNVPSNPATPAANTRATPPSLRSRETTPANRDVPEQNQENTNPNEVTPKAIPIHYRRIELPLPDTASESSRDHDVPSDSDEYNKQLAAELATTIDARTGREVSELPATTYGGTSDNFPRQPATEGQISNPLSTSAFIRPRRLLGKLTTLPGSIFDLTIRLEDRMTSWGRGSQATVRYPEPMDTRIPIYALEVTFWKPGIEARIASGVDWMEMEGVMAILSTKTRKCIWVNGVELRRGPDTGRESFQFGKLYTGDIITVYQHRERDQYLKFRCEFYHGDSACQRPESEKGFVVRNALAPKSDSSRNQQTISKNEEKAAN